MGMENVGWLYEFLVAKAAEISAAGSQRAAVISISLFVSLLCVCIVIGHYYEENRWLNQATIAIILGCAVGFVIYILSNNAELLSFDEQLLFIYLLPPIIFNAGFQVKKKQFFHNFGTIMLFGGSGVLISASIVTAGCRYMFPRLKLGNLQMRDYLALGTIFSATDTVATLQLLHQDETPLLYSLVFGEGVVNDATAVVLFRAVQRFEEAGLDGKAALRMIYEFVYLFSVSTVLGVVIGLIAAYVLKSLYFGKHSTDKEIALMALMAYLSYMLAELFQWSGILSVFFCGIFMSHYGWHNVSGSSKITSKHAFATFSSISESFMFLYVGTNVFNVNIWQLVDVRAASLSCAMLLALTSLGRAAFVFPMSAISNYARGSSSVKLRFRHQVIIWWSGIMRGAVSIALAYQQFSTSSGTMNTDYATMIYSTTGVVLFTTLVVGVVTKPLIATLLPHHLRHLEPSSPKDESCEEANEDGSSIFLRRSSLSMLLANPTSAVHSLWRGFDDSYMRPFFGGGGPVRDSDAWEA
ncbi:sodium/hydrogen exchanger 4 [Selaginella moellendorffii]|uniref:sodium/hydrogen exchanger 4 n=1 Tax=Selaginella moellendorffii TaxID=88036 RepID=UPI000D1CE124|nr:sodium/hydrogen exchanger 4 [Selaginella moellendorffii]|eukprot:XP_024531114.1 sodium/hydrogen exchanger 4 [Selaginella moellendorffii]